MATNDSTQEIKDANGQANQLDKLSDPSRASLDDRNFNRITLSNDLKSQIYSQIDDSTDSLPQWRQGSRYLSNDSVDSTVDESDLQTPMPKEKDPMEDAKPLSRTATAQLSKVDTAKTTGSTGSKDKRPGALRRFTTKLKRTVSSKPDIDPKLTKDA